MWQKFCQHWLESSASFRFLKEFPYVLELGTEDDLPLLPFHAAKTSENQILVTKSYNDMYNRLLRLRQADDGANGGVVSLRRKYCVPGGP